MIWPFTRLAAEPEIVDEVASEAASQRRSACAHLAEIMADVGREAEEIARAIGDSLGSTGR